MIIKEIELNNFRIYHGKNVINLTPDGDRNIVIVSGNNGFGKTTFLMSLVWCLYGQKMGDVDDMYKKEINTHGGYGKYIGTSLNKTAEEKGESEFSVAVTFTDVDIPDITCTEITVKRSYNALTQADDELQIFIDGRLNDLFSGTKEEKTKEEEMFVRDYILPIEIAKFFFFDAEKIVSFAQINTAEQRRELSKAYSQVLGIQKYDDLKNELERIQDDYRKQSANLDDQKEFNQIIADLKNDENLISNNREEIGREDDLKGVKEHELSEISGRLVREGDLMSEDEYQKLLGERDSLVEQRDKISEGIKDLYKYIPLGLSGNLVSGLLKQVEEEKLYKQTSVQLEGVESKTVALLDELDAEKSRFSLENEVQIPIQIRNFYETTIKELIIKHFSNVDNADGFDNFTVLHDFSDIQVGELNTLVSKIKGTKDDFEKLQSQYEKCKGQIFSIEKRIREAEKNKESDYVSRLRDEQRSLNEEKDKIVGRIAILQRESEVANDRIIANKKRKEILSKKIQVGEDNKAVDNEAGRLINKLQKFLLVFKEEKKKALEESLTKKLQSYLHKKNLVSRVVVDINSKGDDVDINLYSPNGKKIDKGELSMGEKQMFASALLSALVDETDIKFPVFIDSPMQKYDVQHTRNILTLFYPQVSKQVILFPLLEKELTEIEYGYIKSIVSKSYLIKNTEKGSSFESVEPDSLFETYKKYNHAN